MNKQKLLIGILSLIFLITFNSIVFLLIKEYSLAFWMAYFFVHFSYLCLLLSIVFFPQAKGSVVLGYPLVYISLWYFLVTFFAGILLMIYRDATLNWALIPNIVITGFFGFKFVSHLLINQRTIEADKKSQSETAFIKTLALDIKELMSGEKSNEKRKKIEKLYDSINNSQLNSCNEALDLEKSIHQKVKEIRRGYNENSLKFDEALNELQDLLTRRNGIIARNAMK